MTDGAALIDLASRATDWIISVDESDGESNHSLYAGDTGVLLCLLEASRATGEPRFTDASQRIAQRLAADVATTEEFGLYTGVAGMGFALKLAGHDAWRDCVRRIADRERSSTDGTDVIFGAAGEGLFCLWTEDDAAIEAASAAGSWLMDVAVADAAGRWWPVVPGQTYGMPNFSHGTAGVGYFLARLAEVTGDSEALAAAMDAGNYLVSVARTTDDTFAVFHHTDFRGLYPLGWCHGPTGTSRMLWKLWQLTGDDSWLERVRGCARMIRTSGIPQRAFPGFWDNVTPCCGSAGVARFFLDLHIATEDPDHLAFAELMTQDLVDRATVDEAGVRWSNIEHRRDDPVLPASTGYMQGTAGVADWLFRFGRFLDGDDDRVVWPDSPW